MAALLLGVPSSHFADKVEWTLRIKDVPYRRIDLPPLGHRAVLRVVNPRGTVPVLRIDSRLLRSSQAAVEYLDEHYPEPPLRATDPEVRAWVAWADTELAEQARRVGYAALRRHPAAAAGVLPLPRALRPAAGVAVRPFVAAITRTHGVTGARMDAARREVGATLERVATALERGDGQHLVGDTLTLADVAVASLIRPFLQVRSLPELAAAQDHPALVWARATLPRRFHGVTV